MYVGKNMRNKRKMSNSSHIPTKSIGELQGAWNSVTSFFGGGKHAYGY